MKLRIFTIVLFVLTLIFSGLNQAIPTLATSNVMVVEVESNPAGQDGGNEWVKLYNPTSLQIHIGGWMIKTTHGKTNSYVIPKEVSLNPCSEFKITFPSQFIDNEDESIILVNSDGSVIDQTPLISDTANDGTVWTRQKPSCSSSPNPEVRLPAKEPMLHPDLKIPSWVKNNAKWWSESKIGDTDFVLGIKYLIEQNVMKIPSTEGGSSNSQQIPSWIKNNAKWWADSQISDDDFVKGIQYLISNGIMKISTIENTTLCQGTKLCITGTVEKIVDGDTIYVKGEKIRLSLTNTPERNEVGYAEATQFTSMLCPVGSTVTVDQDDKQPYDVFSRMVGKVFCNGKMLNEELLLNKHALILTQYCSKSEYGNELWAKKFGCQ